MNAPDSVAPFQPVADAATYMLDAAQRSVLFLDTLRQRGNQFRDYVDGRAEPVLSYDYELVLRGTDLPRPINYGLVRIVPPAGTEIDPLKRPFVVVDPRAGHGPGIGGFKADSEIGMALQAGHPCYFIGFTANPVPGQTIEDIVHGEAAFLRRVIELHADADGKPAVIGNCQAGWAVMIVAALHPELFGPIIIAGAPLSYWAGVRGVNPMRYTGGLLGGSWLTALAGDLGAGRFDGGLLVSNFESMSPANTLWSKQYNVWAKVDSESERYLGFERWWGGHVYLNADEMQWIVDNLFIGNRLATSEIITDHGTRIDLRNIRSPIVCFCSHGDDITPPQQALGWITDLYASVDDIRAHGQTIVYCVHPSVGHLGIFVSGSVARREHGEFATNIDFIDVLPPGLYEATIADRPEGAPAAELVVGNYLLRFEPRSLDDIRALGGNDEADERRFATMARVSEINLGLYRTFLQPWVRASVDPVASRWLSRMSPGRLGYELLSDANPLMAPIAAAAERVRARRTPAGADNPLVVAQEQLSGLIVKSLDAWAKARDSLIEQSFLGLYGSPLLQAMVGLRASDAPPRRRPGNEPEHVAFVAAAMARLRNRLTVGGVREATIRAMVYVLAPQRSTDERGFNLLRQLRREYGGTMKLAAFKEMLREQVAMLRLDADAAIAAIPGLLASEPAHIDRGREALRRMVAIAEPLSEAVAARFVHVDALYGGLATPAETAATAKSAEPAAEAVRPPRRQAATPRRRDAAPVRRGGGGRPTKLA